jgi:hypothetical protein
VYQVPCHVLPADNGYLDFIAAGEQIKAIDKKLHDQGNSPLTWAEAQALAAQIQPALERARQGLRRPHIVPPHETYTVSTLFPYLAPLRELARRGVFYADVQLVRGDRAGALDTYLLLLELGEQVKHGILIPQLVGISIQNIALSGLVNSPLAVDLGLPVGRTLAHDAPRQDWQAEAGAIRQPIEPDWKAAAERLQRLRTHQVPLREALETERETGLNAVYEVLSSPTPDILGTLGGGRSARENDELWCYGLLLRAGLVNRRRAFQEVVTAYGKVLAAVDQGNWYDQDVQISGKRNPLVELLIPPVLGRVRTKVALAHTLFALLEMQCWAAAGEEVTPLPDPFSPGRSLRQREGVFYSVGLDGRDDGGKPLSLSKFFDPEAQGDVSLLSW